MGQAGGAIAGAQALSLLFSAAFLTYWVGILWSYLRRKPHEEGDPAAFEWHLFVPCLDEEAVVGETLTYLRSTFPAAHVWVIDDDSADATASIVALAGESDRLVHLIRRRPPDARTGKGAALNAAYQALREWLPAGSDLGRVLVGVVDADGRPSQNCLAACAGPEMFGDPRVGGVQVEVRIVNRVDRRPLADRGRVANLAARTLVRMQDLEFRSVIGAIQTSRGRTRTVGMGGNGQFTRLAALASLDEGDGRAWRGSLLEDFELGLHLLLAGHLTAFLPDAWVDQEGLPSLRRYLTQRTRWGQGVMQCMRYLPKAWNSPNLTTAGAIETSYYLLQPWLSLLGTIVFPLPVIAMVINQRQSGTDLYTFLRNGGWVMALMYLVLGTTPFWLWGPLYRHRCEPTARRLTALGWGFAYLIYVYGFYVTSWRAVTRIVRGQHGWAKTRRNAEFEPTAVPTHVPLPLPRPVLVPPVPALAMVATGTATPHQVTAAAARRLRAVPAVRSTPRRRIHIQQLSDPTASRSRPRKAPRSRVRRTLHDLARPPPAQISCDPERVALASGAPSPDRRDAQRSSPALSDRSDGSGGRDWWRR